MSGEGKVIGTTELNMKILDIEDKLKTYVVKAEKFQHDILLGRDAIYKFRLNSDFKGNVSQTPLDNPSKNNETNEIKINWNESIPYESFEAKISHLDKEKQECIKKIINDYDSIFAKDAYDVGTVSEFEACIELNENRYVAKKPYRCSYEDQCEIEKQVKELLNHGMISQSSSPFASPVTMAFKKTGNGSKKEKVRMCIDFRELNKLIVPESQPFPLIDDLIVRTRDCSWFTALDLNSAFWSILIRRQDRHKMGFVTQEGHYEWSNMPFGLKNSPAIFQRIITGIIRKFNLSKFCTAYIDDILIFSRTFEEHLTHIRKVIEAILSVGWKLKFIKCNFANRSVNYLGHVISKNEVRPLNDNLISIQNFPVPKNKKNIRQFLGKVNFYLKFIPNAARVLECFHKLLRKDSVFVWDNQCQHTFDKLKTYLTSSPILAIFDRKLPINIYTDASGEGLGAVLKQVQEDGSEKPVAYFSRKLNDYQKKKKAFYIELMAIKEAIEYWKYWLIGNHFKVITDHKPLANLNLKARTDEELGDITNQLLQYDFEVVYRPGVMNSEADCLSRNPVLAPLPEPETLSFNAIQLKEILDSQTLLPAHPANFHKGTTIYRKMSGKDRIVLDPIFGRKLVAEIHEKLGHIGAKHLLLIMKEYYFFSGMNDFINNYSSQCDICIKNKTRKNKTLGELGYLGPATKPFEIMSLDTAGGFGGRRSTKRYLHILIDHFTRFIYVSCSAGQTATDFIRFLTPIHSENKIGTLLTDQYGSLGSDQFLDYLRDNGIQHYFTALDMPSSNGLNERSNQTMINRIRCRINDPVYNSQNYAWSTIAHKCVDEYNRTPHSITTFSPVYLLTGQFQNSFAPSGVFPLHDLVRDRDIALCNSIRSHEENKRRVDKRMTKVKPLLVGDLVYVENGNKLNRRKLDQIRIGPFPVSKVISRSIYEVNTGSNRKRLFHLSKIIPLRNKL